MNLFLLQDQSITPFTELVLIVIFFSGIAAVVLNKTFIYVEQQYAIRQMKPFFRSFVLLKKDLTKEQVLILEQNFKFYNELTTEEKDLFRHRLSSFINEKLFIGRKGLKPTETMKVLISATAVMLTFGFRNYKIEIIEKIIIYPSVYYSKINNTHHKGETNPQLRSIVFSWEDFEKGYQIGDDNLNLGIHEFGHAIHLNAFDSGDISSIIFTQGFENLTSYLQKHKVVRERLIKTKYFRAYAYTNHFEFFAVLLENFVETPQEFKSQFPMLYKHIKQMMNFDFTNY